MKLRKFAFLLFSLVFIISCSVYAAPIVGSSANTLKSRSFMFEGHFFYHGYTARYYIDGEEWISFPPDHSYVVMGLLPQLYYGVFDFLTVRLTSPVSMNNRNYGTSEKSKGFGDIVIDFKHRIIKGLGFIPTISYFGGIRLPTGDKETEPPLGDGSTDGVFGLLVTEKVPVLTTHLNLGYWYNGKVEGYDIPDVFFYNIAVEFPLPLQSAVVGELNCSTSGSGIDQKYLYEFCPGVTNKSFPGLVLEASVKIPFKARGGLRYDFSPFVGFMYFF